MLIVDIYNIVQRSQSEHRRDYDDKEKISIDVHLSRESDDDDKHRDDESPIPTPLIDLNKINIKRHNKSVGDERIFFLCWKTHDSFSF